jgi:hypothetical protein
MAHGSDDPTVMDTAMNTGSDAGEPGERLEGPLTGDERVLLDRLAHDDAAPVVTDAPEDSPAAARAAADDTVLPEPAPEGGPDPDTPQFREPGGPDTGAGAG